MAALLAGLLVLRHLDEVSVWISLYKQIQSRRSSLLISGKGARLWFSPANPNNLRYVSEEVTLTLSVSRIAP